MTDQKVAYRGEAQLMRWSDSNSGGPTITLMLPDSEDLEHFRGATTRKGGKAGQLYAVMIVEVGEDGSGDVQAPANDNRKAPAGPHGEYYRSLYRMGWFFNPHLWPCIGSDEEFQAWLRLQPCCARNVHIMVGGELAHCAGDVVVAHVRRIASGAGTGIKPPHSAVPLCNHHHQLQHAGGESVFGDAGGSTGKDWFDKQRADHLVRWIKSRLYGLLNTDSLAKVHPDNFEALIIKLGAGDTLPRRAR